MYNMCICVYIYIYIYITPPMPNWKAPPCSTERPHSRQDRSAASFRCHVCVYIYIYRERERERERGREGERERERDTDPAATQDDVEC